MDDEKKLEDIPMNSGTDCDTMLNPDCDECHECDECDECDETARCTDDQESEECGGPELAKQLEEARAAYIRLQADFENYRRRSEREKESIGIYANECLMKAILPALDNFDRAIAVAGDESHPLVSGVLLVRKQLIAALERAGLCQLEALGMQFNPNLHEAIGHVETEEHEEDTVVEELQKGYSLGGRLLRPAMVRVSRN